MKTSLGGMPRGRAARRYKAEVGWERGASARELPTGATETARGADRGPLRPRPSPDRTAHEARTTLLLLLLLLRERAWLG